MSSACRLCSPARRSSVRCFGRVEGRPFMRVGKAMKPGPAAGGTEISDGNRITEVQRSKANVFELGRISNP